LYGYQNKGVARGAICIVMKTKGQKLGVFGEMEAGAGLLYEYRNPF
jgi:hypothetical protein